MSTAIELVTRRFCRQVMIFALVPLTLRAEYEIVTTEESSPDAGEASRLTATAPRAAAPAGAHDVVENLATDEPGSGISSIVRYTETEDGSFLSIEEIASAANADSGDGGSGERGRTGHRSAISSESSTEVGRRLVHNR